MNNNKILVKKWMVITSILTVIFLGAGLVFIQLSTLNLPLGGFDPITGEMIGIKMTGFEVLNMYSVDTVLSSGLFRHSLLAGSHLSVLKAGVTFAVILAPMLFGITALLGGHYYLKYANQSETILLNNTNIHKEYREENVTKQKQEAYN